MKKIIVLVLATIMLFVLVACNSNQENSVGSSDSVSIQEESKPTETTIPTQNEETQPADPLDWGVGDHYSAENEGGIELYYINLPYYAGANKGNGKIAEQLDGTVVILAGQDDDTPSISELSEVFPAYFNHLQYTMEKFYGLLADNFAFSITNSDTIAINDYDMQTYTGVVTFDDDGDPQSYNFVVYATTLKSNGAYAYWVVYDTTEDQSNGELIAEHALNMAKTFREEQ